MDRPLAATAIPVVFLAASIGFGFAFEGRQRAEGTPALHVAGKRLEDQLDRASAQTDAQLSSVEVQGDRGVTAFHVQTVVGDRLVARGERRFRWTRAPGGGWAAPQPLAEAPAPVPTPFRRR